MRRLKVIVTLIAILLLAGWLIGVWLPVRTSIVEQEDTALADTTVDRGYTFFTDDSIPGFEFDGLYWQDLNMPDTFSLQLLGQRVAAGTDCFFQFNTDSFCCEDSIIPNVSLSSLFSAHPGLGYWIDFPRVRVIMVDTEHLHRLVHYTRLLCWMRSAIERHDDRFTVVLMVRPMYRHQYGRLGSLMHWFIYETLDEEADLVISANEPGYQCQLPFVETSTDNDVHLRLAIYGEAPTDTLRVRAYLNNNDSLLDETYVLRY